MKNSWSEHHLMAAKHAEWAAAHYRRAADYYIAGNTEKAIHHALLAVTQLEYSSHHAQQANEFYFKTAQNNLPEALTDN